MTRVIRLPAINRTIRLGVYVAGVKLAIAHPDRKFKYGLDCWWPCTGAEIREQFREAMHDRINQRVPAIQRGAK